MRLALTTFRALALPLLLLAPQASEANKVKLRWTNTTGSGTTGHPFIAVSNTQPETLTLDVIVETGEAGLSGVFFSLEFDTDLENELDLVSRTHFYPHGLQGLRSSQESGPTGLRSSHESSSTQPGRLYTFDAVTYGSVPGNVALLLARIEFVTNPENISTDGLDVVSGTFGPDGSGLDDGLFDGQNPGVEVTASTVFQGAGVGTMTELPALPWIALVGVWSILLGSAFAAACTGNRLGHEGSKHSSREARHRRFGLEEGTKW